MQKKLIDFISIERATAFVTWLIVAGISVYFMARDDRFSVPYLALVVALYVGFFALWCLSTRETRFKHEPATRWLLIVAEYAIIIAIYFLVPYSFNAILMVIWSGHMPYMLKMRWVLALSPFWSAPVGLIYHLYWQLPGALITGLLFWTFNLFALVMVNSMLREKLARQAADNLNRELQATQSLLNQATKQAERIRIARNIHDLLGHHLTALTINLQVAARTSEGDNKKQIEQCHSLAKLLLSDVREAVSEIREKSTLELDVAIRALTTNLPGKAVTFACDPEIQVTDVAIADTVLRCVQECLTNNLKHSNGDQIHINISREQQLIKIRITDNGTPAFNFSVGNGLSGIQERAELHGGTASFAAGDDGFAVTLCLPEGPCQ